MAYVNICVCARESVCICFYLFIYNKFFFLFFFGEILRVTSRKEFRTRMKPYCYVTKIFIKLTQSAKKTKDGKKNDEYTDENRKTLSPPYRKRRMCCCVQPLAAAALTEHWKIFHRFSHILSCSLRKFSQFTVHVREMECMCECSPLYSNFPLGCLRVLVWVQESKEKRNNRSAQTLSQLWMLDVCVGAEELNAHTKTTTIALLRKALDRRPTQGSTNTRQKILSLSM